MNERSAFNISAEFNIRWAAHMMATSESWREVIVIVEKKRRTATEFIMPDVCEVCHFLKSAKHTLISHCTREDHAYPLNNETAG